MRFDFKKIASVATSALMMGSTVALAAAASFPAPFVQSGAANVGIVYGSNAASSDLVAAADIQSSLSEALASQGGSGSVSIDGESYPLFGSGNSKIWHNETLNSQRKTVTDTELPTILAETSLSGNVDADITHQITFGSFPRFQYSQQPTSDDDPTWNIGLSTNTANALYNATVIFDQTVNFTSPDTEGENFMMFGQEFTVGSATDNSNLVLFRASETIFLDSQTNPSQTVEVDGVTYTVELVSASDTDATIRVTDSSGASDQKEISEAASKKIQGLEVSVNNADESDALGRISVEVVVGADKIKLSNGNSVLFGSDEDSIDGTKVTFSSGLSTQNISQITFQVTADDSDEDAILPGRSFRDPIFDSFEVVFGGVSGDSSESMSVDYSGNDKLTFKMTDHRGSEKTIFWLYNGTTDVAHPDAVVTNGQILSDEDELINVREMAIVNKTHYVVVSDSEENDGYLLRLESIQNQSGTDNDVVRFKDIFSDDTYESSTITTEGVASVNIQGTSYTVNYWKTATDDGYVRVNDPNSASGVLRMFPTIETEKGAKVAFYQPLQINLGNFDGADTDVSSFSISDGDGYDPTTTTVNSTSPGNWFVGGTALNTTSAAGVAGVTDSIGRLTFNFTSSGTQNLTNVYLVSPAGGNIANPALIVFEGEDDNNNFEAIVVEPEGSGTDAASVGVSTATRTSFSQGGFGPTGYITHDSDSDLSSTATLWGSVLTLDAAESDQKTLDIMYPSEQVNAEVYVAESGAATGGADLGSISVMDSEVSQVSGKNLIVVGGSCVNTVAADLLGSDSPLCSNGWQSATSVGAGQFLIQTFNSPFTSGRVATLVAGYNAGDTTNAATFFTTQNVQTDSGKKYVGSSATSASLVTN